jgi:hypothetical protein
MQPTRDTHATLVDLLDRVLEKGLVLNADLMIHIAGIPLLGVNLKACLAGMETMLQYGMWQDWDEAQRSIATTERRQKERDASGSKQGNLFVPHLLDSYKISK